MYGLHSYEPHKSYLSTTEVMVILEATLGTVCGWVRTGVIRAARIGKENKFHPASVEALPGARQVWWIGSRHPELHLLKSIDFCPVDRQEFSHQYSE
jgi:hypothetical protein